MATEPKNDIEPPTSGGRTHLIIRPMCERQPLFTQEALLAVAITEGDTERRNAILKGVLFDELNGVRQAQMNTENKSTETESDAVLTVEDLIDRAWWYEPTDEEAAKMAQQRAELGLSPAHQAFLDMLASKVTMTPEQQAFMATLANEAAPAESTAASNDSKEV